MFLAIIIIPSNYIRLKKTDMKAMILKQYGGVENFQLQEIDSPTIKDDEVLINQSHQYQPGGCKNPYG